MKPGAIIFRLIFLIISLSAAAISLSAQEAEATPKPKGKSDGRVRTVTIPISIFGKKELNSDRVEEFLPAGDILVKEDGEDQVVLSIRSSAESPMSIAFLIQDNISTDFNLELKELAEFIRRLPEGTRVFVGYLRGGSLQVRQRFTDDLEKASSSLRIVTGSVVSAPGNLFDEVHDALGRFDALPAGRRAIFLVSDGVDTSGFGFGSPGQSPSLERATLKAQRKGVAIYSIYYSSGGGGSSPASLIAQSNLQAISTDTGGRAFFQGSGSPVSIMPFLREVNFSLGRQFVLSYLSTHMRKGYHRVKVMSTNPDVKIEHPKGYYYR